MGLRLKVVGRALASLTCGLLAAGCNAQPSESTSQNSDAKIVLEGDGLGVVAFGEPQKEVEFELTDLLGAPDIKDASPPDCGDLPLNRAVWWGPLRVGFRDGEFVHYLYVPPQGIDDAFTTAEGIGVGSTLDEMKKAYGSDLEKGPVALGDSYQLETGDGEVYAVFSDAVPAPGAARGVYGLAAGTTCN